MIRPRSILHNAFLPCCSLFGYDRSLFYLVILDSFTRLFPPKLCLPFKTTTYLFILGFESLVSP